MLSGGSSLLSGYSKSWKELVPEGKDILCPMRPQDGHWTWHGAMVIAFEETGI